MNIYLSAHRSFKSSPEAIGVKTLWLVMIKKTQRPSGVINEKEITGQDNSLTGLSYLRIVSTWYKC